MALAIIQFRDDALTDARRDIANLALVLGEQTSRSIQSIDLVLRGLQDSVAALHVARMVAVRPLRDYPLVVNAVVAQDAVLATWRRQATYLAAGSLIAFSYAAYLMFVTGRQFKRLRKSRASLLQRNEELVEMSNSLVSSQTSLADLTDELETTLETMEQGLIMVDWQGLVVQCNGRARRMLDLPDELIQTRPTFESVLDYQWNTNLSGREDGTFDEFLRRRLIVDRPHTQEIKRPDGRTLEARSIPMAAGGFVRTYSDITERKAAEDKVHYLAHHDNLTRLVNRVVFHERLEQALVMARTSRRGTAVLYLDLDHFKAVNDTRGHEVGDRVLTEAAQRMRASVRSVDTVARFGGDEFAIILPFLESREAAGQLAERLTSSLARPYVIEDIPSCIGVSIGIAIFPDDGLNAEQLVRRADGALYQAKHAGRNTYRFHAVAAEPIEACA